MATLSFPLRLANAVNTRKNDPVYFHDIKQLIDDVIDIFNHNITMVGSFTATSFVKTGGIATQYLMADGSVTTGGVTSQWTTVGLDIYYNTGNVWIGTTGALTSDTLQVMGTAYFTEGIGVLGSIPAANTGINILGTTSALRFLHMGMTGTDAYVGVASSAGGSLITGSAPYSMEIRNDTEISFGTGSTLRARLNSVGLAVPNSFAIGGAVSATSVLNITGLPTSSAGLAAGDVWSDSGTLKIV